MVESVALESEQRRDSKTEVAESVALAGLPNAKYVELQEQNQAYIYIYI